MQDHKLNRRRFLTLVAQGSLVTAVIGVASQVVRFLAFQPPSAISTIFPAGGPDAYPPGPPAYVAGARVYIGRDAGGFYAVDAVCSHLGCLVEQHEKGGFVCPCHASRFDGEGQVLTGPATQGLQHLHIWLDQGQGQLFVDRGEPVEPSARLIL